MTNSNSKRIPMEEVMAWLSANHPGIMAEPDRAWLWLIADLRGDQHKATRDSLKAYGFKFAAGGHKLPSGQVSHWAHSCDRPKAFTRKGRGHANGNAMPKSNGSRKARRPQSSDDAQRVDPMEYTPQQPTMDEQTMAEIAAAFA